MRLLLIRHGQTPSNVAGALDTAFPGAGLTSLGEVQAGAVPAALAHEDVRGVYASRLTRTQLTAAPLATARGLDVHVRPGLEEVVAGELEMLADDASVRVYAGCLADWLCGDLERRVPGGETGHGFVQRYDAAVRGLVAGHGAGDTVAVFSHGAAIRVWASVAAGVDPAVSTELRLMNTGMAVLEGDPARGWALERWHAEPLGGLALEDSSAHDVTGESAEEAAHEGA